VSTGTMGGEYTCAGEVPITGEPALGELSKPDPGADRKLDIKGERDDKWPRSERDASEFLPMGLPLGDATFAPAPHRHQPRPPPTCTHTQEHSKGIVQSKGSKPQLEKWGKQQQSPPRETTQSEHRARHPHLESSQQRGTRWPALRGWRPPALSFAAPSLQPPQRQARG
jgi:hypothetical protein